LFGTSSCSFGTHLPFAAAFLRNRPRGLSRKELITAQMKHAKENFALELSQKCACA